MAPTSNWNCFCKKELCQNPPTFPSEFGANYENLNKETEYSKNLNQSNFKQEGNLNLDPPDVQLETN